MTSHKCLECDKKAEYIHYGHGEPSYHCFDDCCSMCLPLYEPNQQMLFDPETWGGEEYQAMAYCRFSEADAYIYFSVGGELRCCGCLISTPRMGVLQDFVAKDTKDMLYHIIEHRKAKHYIPYQVDESLERDQQVNDSYKVTKSRRKAGA